MGKTFQRTFWMFEHLRTSIARFLTNFFVFSSSSYFWYWSFNTITVFCILRYEGVIFRNFWRHILEKAILYLQFATNRKFLRQTVDFLQIFLCLQLLHKQIDLAAIYREFKVCIHSVKLLSSKTFNNLFKTRISWFAVFLSTRKCKGVQIHQLLHWNKPLQN